MINNRYSEPPKLEGYYYSFDEAKEARDSGKILTIRLETSRACNLRCEYCCNRSGRPLKWELPHNKLIDIIKQAKELGAKSVVIIGGGEPTIYPKFRKLIKNISSLKMIPVVFTNTQTMSKNLAAFLFKNNASVIIKLDSLNEKIQDKMAGVKGVYRRIQNGLKNLWSAGYKSLVNKGKYKLGASFVVNRQNSNEIQYIWKFCRENKIIPNMEMMIPNGLAKGQKRLMLRKKEWKNLKLKLLDLDRKEFNYDWFPYTPLAGMGCFQVIYNLYISIDGKVRPCSSIHCNVANINKLSLKQIIDLPFFKIARNIEKYLKGKCGKCKNHKKCIGCRGLAYSTNKTKGKGGIASLCNEDSSCFLRLAKI